jgi:hypothetical protein
MERNMALTIEKLNQFNQGATLMLKEQGIVDDDMPLICNYLRQYPAITNLDITANQIGPKGARILADNASIPVLIAEANQLGDEGAIALAANPHFTTLNVRDNNIGDAGALAIAARASTNLRFLHADFNNITNKGAVALAEAGIHILSLSGNYIGPYGAAMLRAFGTGAGTQRRREDHVVVADCNSALFNKYKKIHAAETSILFNRYATEIPISPSP